MSTLLSTQVQKTVNAETRQWPLPLGPNPRTDAELGAYRKAKLADQETRDALDYLHGLDNRLKRAYAGIFENQNMAVK